MFQTVKTRTADFYISDNGILHIVMLPDVLVDELDVYDNNLVVRNLLQGKKLPRLLDSRAKGWQMTAKAKELMKEQILPHNIVARAILVNSMLGKNILNLLKVFKSQQNLVKYFTSYEEAVKWLIDTKK